MAKIMQIQKSEYKDGRLVTTGSIGRHEEGLAMATADYLASGGTAHRPDAQERGVILPINTGRYNVLVGCETLIELEAGESAFFSVTNGTVQACIIAKQDGTLELNGNSDHAVLYTPLKHFTDELINWANTHTHAQHGTPAATPFTTTLDAQSKGVKLS